jgi:hypothetical protein
MLTETWTPTAADLRSYAGRYSSEEAETSFDVVEENGKLLLRGRYDRRIELLPAYRDAFTTSDGPGIVIFRRDARGRTTTMSFGMGRVRDLQFRRVGR